MFQRRGSRSPQTIKMRIAFRQRCCRQNLGKVTAWIGKNTCADWTIVGLCWDCGVVHKCWNSIERLESSKESFKDSFVQTFPGFSSFPNGDFGRCHSCDCLAAICTAAWNFCQGFWVSSQLTFLPAVDQEGPLYFENYAFFCQVCGRPSILTTKLKTALHWTLGNAANAWDLAKFCSAENLRTAVGLISSGKFDATNTFPQVSQDCVEPKTILTRRKNLANTLRTFRCAEILRKQSEHQESTESEVHEKRTMWENEEWEAPGAKRASKISDVPQRLRANRRSHKKINLSPSTTVCAGKHIRARSMCRRNPTQEAGVPVYLSKRRKCKMFLLTDHLGSDPAGNDGNKA